MYFRVFILVMTKLNFQQPYLSLQYHMILQKSFWYPYWFLNKYFLSLLKTGVETDIHFLMKFKKKLFKKKSFYLTFFVLNIIKKYILKMKSYWPQTF